MSAPLPIHNPLSPSASSSGSSTAMSPPSLLRSSSFPGSAGAAAAGAVHAPELKIVPSTARSGRFVIDALPVTLDFETGVDVLHKAIVDLKNANGGTVFVAIAGPSGAGKTSIADKIHLFLPETLIISMDNYLDASRTVIDENFDDFRLIDFDLLAKNIMEIQEGKPTESPLYDFRKSGRYAYQTLVPPSNGVLIVEGTYALQPSLRHLYDLTVSVSGGVHYDLVKRVMRDMTRTGQGAKDIIDQITQTVYPMYKAFIEPHLMTADIRIVNKFNPFSSVVEGLFSIKTKVTKQEAAELTKKYVSAKTEKYYDIYLHPPSMSPHDCKSWIRLRNFNGRYSVLFSEVQEDGPYSISKRMEFTVSVKTLGGLMGLGYQIGAVLHRESVELETCEPVVLSIDKVEQLGHDVFIQVKGAAKEAVERVFVAMFRDTDCAIPGSYIDLYEEMLRNNSGSPIRGPSLSGF
eukprot:ANDGO_00789.mRNA.1 Uridine-cytidine kinase C